MIIAINCDLSDRSPQAIAAIDACNALRGAGYDAFIRTVGSDALSEYADEIPTNKAVNEDIGILIAGKWDYNDLLRAPDRILWVIEQQNVPDALPVCSIASRICVDSLDTLSDLSKMAEVTGMSIIAYVMKAAKETFVESFKSMLAGDGQIRIGNSPKDWLVPYETIDERGEISRLPAKSGDARQHYEIDLVNLLKQLSSSRFRLVYIFKPEFRQISGAELSHMLHALVKIGNKSYDIIICTDVDIPNEWKPITNRLTLMSIKEAEKRFR